MAALAAQRWKQAAGIVDASRGRGYGRLIRAPRLNQSIHSFDLTMQRRCGDRAVRIRSVIAQEID